LILTRTAFAAKDLGTGKEQTVKIEQSSGLSEDEIKRMQQDAAAHAEEDKKKRDSTERTMRDMGDKIDAQTRQNIEEQIGKLRKTMEDGDKDAIQKDMDQLMQISHKVAEEAYKRAAEQQGPQAGAEEQAARESAGAQKKPDDDVVDADFQEVKDK